MKRIVCALLCMVLMLSAASCGKEEKTTGDQLFFSDLSAEPVSLDPQVAADDAAKIVLNQLFEGLVRIGPEGEVRMGAAERIESEENSTVFTFHLRKDGRWSDGTQLRAEDFLFALRRAIDPRTGSPAAQKLFCIKNGEAIHNGELPPEELGAEAPDQFTLRITLEYSYQDFPAQTAHPVFFPCSERFFRDTAGRYGMEARHVLGNGPFELRKKSGWSHGEYVRLVRCGAYKGEAAVPSGVLFRIRQPEDPVGEILEHRVDLAAIGEQDLPRAEQEGLQIESFTDTTWGLCVNASDPVFSETEIRRGLMLSISRSGLSEAIPEKWQRADQLIPPETSCMGKPYRPQAGSCVLPEQNPEEARQALARGLRNLNLERLPAVTVLCPDTPEAKILVNSLLGSWSSSLGYYFNLEAISQEKLEKRVAAGRFQLALIPVRAGEDGPQNFLSRLCQSAGYRSEAYDALYSRLFSDTVAAAKEAEQLLIDDCVFYPMYYTNRYYALDKTVQNVVIQPFSGIIDFRAAEKQTES